jgi:predicted signal transduction protein with EAL and GGDEF domain
MAQRLQSIVRPSDTVARLGGDEFGVLLEGANQPAAEIAAARILSEFEKPVTVAGSQVFVHACIGIAIAEIPVPADDLLSNADAAMYAAKTRGKNQFRVFRPSMHVAARRRFELRGELQRAVERSEFVVYYQPIVELGTGRISGLEALVRWDHPELGIVPPSEFMPIAEESGLIVPIGTGVMREAASWLQEMNGVAAPLTLAVNLSPRQLVEPDILESIESVLEDSALEPERLVVDITESVLLSEAEAVVPLLADLRTRGVRVAVDDFGTGYSSLSYLRRLPIDLLKIDRAFVSGMTEAVEDVVVAEAVVKLAGALGFSTIAEGIETPEQARELQALGSTFGQGYLYGPPLASADARRVLEEQV